MKKGKLQLADFPYTMGDVFCKPPYWYRNVEAIQVGFETDYDAVADMIPAPLEIDDVPQGIVMFIDIPFSTLGEYYECLLMFQVKYEGKPFLYCQNLYVTHEAPLIAGREIWGFPKKEGKMRCVRERNHISFSLERPEGTRLITATVTPQYNQPHDSYENCDLLVLRLIPNPATDVNSATDTPDIAQLVGCGYTLDPIVSSDGLAELFTGIASLNFNDKSNDDPSFQIPINKITFGRWGRFNNFLPAGYIVHDYLK